MARRVAQAALVAWLAATLVFVLVHLAPGDPFTASLDNPSVSPEARARWMSAYGLDRPVLEQYGRYLLGVLRGELGWSFSQARPVADAIRGALPNTLVLMGVALGGSFVVGVALGAWQAARRGSAAERAVSRVSLFVYSLPDFWLALVLLVALTYWVRLFPTGGITNTTLYPLFGPWERVVDRLWHLALPAGTLMLLSAAGIARFQRAAMLEVLGEDFVRTARAKGVSERRVVLRHAWRNALLPMVTLLGLMLPALVGGAVFVEKVFAWPGMGLLLVTAVEQRDYWLVTACVLVGSVMVALGSLLADLLSAAVDPRLRAR